MSLKSTFKSMFIAKEEERARLLQEQEMQEAAQQFFDKELRTVSVRLDPFILAQIDGLAQYLEESRQTIFGSNHP
jgi:formate dehydrogenase maturation protein FdhE